MDGSETRSTPTVSTRFLPYAEASPPANGAMASCATANEPKTEATAGPGIPTSTAYSGKNGATMAKVLLIVQVWINVAPRNASCRGVIGMALHPLALWHRLRLRHRLRSGLEVDMII